MDTADVVEPLVPPDVLRAIRDVVGPKGWIDEAAALEPYLREERGYFKAAAPPWCVRRTPRRWRGS